MFLVVAVANTGGGAEATLLGILCGVGGFLGLIVMLFHGRHPWDYTIERYDSVEALDVHVPLEVLSNLSGHLFRRNYRAAHNCMLAHTNWFFSHRMYLPDHFANMWLIIRTRINRMVHFNNWPQDWAERDLEKMREETLQLLEEARRMLYQSGNVEEDTEVYEIQPERETSAPSARSLSSMHS